MELLKIYINVETCFPAKLFEDFTSICKYQNALLRAVKYLQCDSSSAFQN